MRCNGPSSREQADPAVPSCFLFHPFSGVISTGSVFLAMGLRPKILIIFSFIINEMLLLDSITLLLVIVGLHLIKFKYPNFLFFCKGAILFLPPNEEKAPANPMKKSKKIKQQIQIQILQVEYAHVKEYPMSDEYDRIIFLIAGLLIYIPLKWLFCLVVDAIKGQPFSIPSSSFIFVVCLVTMVYAIKIGLQIFWISSYNLKYCFLFGFGVNALFFMLYFSLSGLGTYDKQLQWSLDDYRKLLSIIFSRRLSEQTLNINWMLVLILIINTIFTLVSIPAVIKFGNWYTKTLKQIYYEDQETEKIEKDQEKIKKQAQEAELKKKSIKSIRMLNFYLVSVLIFLFFSHSYSRRFIDDRVADLVRVMLMAVIVYINCYTLKDAIQFNGSFAYKFLSLYATSESHQQRKSLRQKIMPYLYLIWYHKFQFMFRIIIPLLLFLMVLDWKYMHLDDAALKSTPVISQTHCAVQTNQLKIIQNLYRCDVGSDSQLIHKMSEPFINGMLIGGKNGQEMSTVQQKIARYGILNANFMVQFLETLLWYTNFTVYGMTIVYILFLRKTVYDI